MRVLDAGAIMEGDYEGVTCPKVAGELGFLAHIEVIEPKKEFLKKIEAVAKKTGDWDVLSEADKEILALALQLKGTLITNDFAIQNVASSAGIKWDSTSKEISKKRIWTWYCPACGKKFNKKQECDVCGTLTKRRPIKQKAL